MRCGRRRGDEQRARGLVDADVGGLRRQQHRGQQLEHAGVVQLGGRVRVGAPAAWRRRSRCRAAFMRSRVGCRRTSARRWAAIEPSARTPRISAQPARPDAPMRSPMKSGAGGGREHGLRRQHDRRVGRARVALRDHLQREAEADGQHAGVDDRAQRLRRCRAPSPARWRGRATSASALHATNCPQATSIAPCSLLAARPDQHHVRGPRQAAGDDPPVAGVEVRTGCRRRSAATSPTTQPAAASQVVQCGRWREHEPAQHRHQRDVQRGQEAGVGHAGGEHADLLHRRAEEQQRAQAGDVREVARRAAGGCARAACATRARRTAPPRRRRARSAGR